MEAYVATVPLLQTLAWILLIAVVLFWGRKLWRRIFRSVGKRIRRGDGVKLSYGSWSAELEHSAAGAVRLEPNPKVPQPGAGAGGTEVSELESVRVAIGTAQRGVHLVHVAVPSERFDRWYDIFVYLSGYRRSNYDVPDDLSDVSSAEFQIGPKFTPSAATVTNAGRGRLGFTTSAHGPFLCTCRITFTDGATAVLSRFIDFEAARLAERAA